MYFSWLYVLKTTLLQFCGCHRIRAMFIKTIDYVEAYKDKFYIANKINEAIIGVGVNKVV